jgi:group I intron endonuclease
MGFIYKATYRVSGKAYIGQTIQPILKRLGQHQLPSSNCVLIYRAIKKHGWENFDVEWHEIPDDELNFYEEMLVALLGTLAPGGYNLKEGGGAHGKYSEESKQKMSEAHVGKTHTEESKENMSKAKSGEKNPMYGKTHTTVSKEKIREATTGENNPMYGKTHTEETKEKISASLSSENNPMYGRTGEKHPMYGKTHTDETKKKISKAKLGANNPTSKKVYRYNLDGTFVDSFESSGEAARALGKKDGSSIRACARGDRPSAYGFKWTRELL